MSLSAVPHPDLPAVDARLVAPESRYEIVDGRVCYVSPSDEPHGTRHSKVSALVEAHAAEEYEVASDMLTRTSKIDDIAPDVSVFPSERNPETGGRKLEELAFQVVSTESLGHAGDKAKKLAERGVRRVFAIDVERQRALEWSREASAWRALDRADQIVDPALAAPLPIEALVHAAKADDAVARALLAKHNPVLQAALLERREQGSVEGRIEGRIEGLAQALIAVLTARGLAPSPAERQRILGERDAGAFEVWLAGALSCSSIAELLERRK